MKTKQACIILVLMLPVLSDAYEQTAMVYGGVDCGEWTQIKHPPDKSWLLGFMSGMNIQHLILTQGKSDPLKKVTSANQIWSWMDNYCQKNPLNKVSQGGLDLFQELKKK